MRTDILDFLQKEIYARCGRTSNRFGMGVYHHIAAVVKNSMLLADRYGADREVVMVAAWLHDIASVTDEALYENHHIYGAEMAEELLTKLDYEPSKISLVQDCIRNHRGSVRLDRHRIEEVCVADADAISHFDAVPSLLYLAFVNHQKGMEEGIRFVRDKLERSYQKMSQESKEFYQEKYRTVMNVLAF